MKKMLRLLYFQSIFFRRIINVLLWFSRPQNRLATGHLATFQEESIHSSIQRDEALFLFGIIRAIRPKIVVEFRFHCGHSAFNFLQALSGAGQLYSYDISDESCRIAAKCFAQYTNFHFLKKSQEFFSPDDVGGGKRISFIDASHDLKSNQKTFSALVPSLADKAIVGVHDTGTWFKKYFSPDARAFADSRPDNWINDEEFYPIEAERGFVNWIGCNYPDFQIIHFHSKNHLRYGITLLQKNRLLNNRSGLDPV